MSFSEEEFLELLEEQFQIFNKVAEDIIDNALKFHKQHCGNEVNCEIAFMNIFMELFSHKVATKASNPIHRSYRNSHLN